MNGEQEQRLRQLGRRRAQLQAQRRVVAEAIGRELLALRDAGELRPAEAARALGATRRAVYRWIEVVEAADGHPSSMDGGRPMETDRRSWPPSDRRVGG